MTDLLPVFVHGALVRVPPGATALDAVVAADPEAAQAIREGRRALTDSRGLPADPAAPITAGAVFRLVSARAAGVADA